MFVIIRSHIMRNLPNTYKIVSRSAHLDFSPNWKLSKKIWSRYRKLRVDNCKFPLTYVWIDGTGQHLRSKIRVMDYNPSSYKECPNLDFDGSACFLSDVRSSDLILCPIALYNDPNNHAGKIVFCETHTEDGKPTKTNHRLQTTEILNKMCDKEPMFAFKQAFTFMDVNNRPFGWPVAYGEPSPRESYYCSVGAGKVNGREIIQCTFKACIFAGIELTTIQLGPNPSQWQFQIGPSLGIKSADDTWMTRYLIHRVAEEFGVAVSFHPKLLPNWPGAGCFMHFSTKETRQDDGYKHIEEMVKRLEKKHAEVMKLYGDDEKKKFTSGVNDRTVSVRISRKVAHEKKGCLEDRRVPANADPYQAIHSLASAVLDAPSK